MTYLSTSAIVLRRRAYGDFDLILTVLTREQGVRTLIAKAAKKSTKRFPGILEHFDGLRIVYRRPRGKGLPVLEEASLEQNFGVIRSDVVKTAYASYWSELVAMWLEAEEPRHDIYDLLCFVLDALSRDSAAPALLSLLFQMRFIGREGLRPVLERCTCCHTDVEQLPQNQFCIDLKQGGIVCNQCPAPDTRQLKLGKGTIKQLLWMARGDMKKALRIRFAADSMEEATRFMEAFVPFHIGRVPKSLGFLKQIRTSRS
jgi:DNA repair protein RecO (recombination protein O)